jgi:hypothetical protein
MGKREGKGRVGDPKDVWNKTDETIDTAVEVSAKNDDFKFSNVSHLHKMRGIRIITENNWIP